MTAALATARKWARDRASYVKSLLSHDPERQAMAARYARPESWDEDARALAETRGERWLIMKEAAATFVAELKGADRR